MEEILSALIVGGFFTGFAGAAGPVRGPREPFRAATPSPARRTDYAAAPLSSRARISSSE